LNLKIGTDICSVVRVREAYERFGDKLISKLFTDEEKTYALSRPKRIAEIIAARIAAKEAVSKVLGTGWYGLHWKEVEVTKKRSGEPGIALHGRAVEAAARLGLKTFEVSISHEREFAVAFVVAYGD
jgi:holo-[acyl-carrier protein] synthase